MGVNKCYLYKEGRDNIFSSINKVLQLSCRLTYYTIHRSNTHLLYDKRLIHVTRVTQVINSITQTRAHIAVVDYQSSFQVTNVFLIGTERIQMCLVHSHTDSTCFFQVRCVSSMVPRNFDVLDSAMKLLLCAMENFAGFLFWFRDFKNVVLVLFTWRLFHFNLYDSFVYYQF